MAAKLPIAVQLYSLRNLQMPFDQLLAEVAAIGYTGVETVGDHGLTAEQMNELLHKHGLQVASAHVSMAKFENELDNVVAFNRAVGNTTLVVPILMEARDTSTKTGWQALGQRLAALGQQVRAAGIRLLYHNHAFEMVQIEDRLAIDILLEADPDLGFEIDLAWVHRGGQDGLQLLQKYAGRCSRVHCKDVAPLGQNQDEMGFADVGYGVLDWDALLPAAKAAGAEWYIVEHDLPKEPLLNIRRSFEFLQEKLVR
jgi:sugar phosphate isomerase/epimerase